MRMSNSSPQHSSTVYVFIVFSLKLFVFRDKTYSHGNRCTVVARPHVRSLPHHIGAATSQSFLAQSDLLMEGMKKDVEQIDLSQIDL